ncbi:divergent polysaccharide deacetylase family protein [Marinicauda salina]|uniref:divergent polysaccharide deacetylase family protein n=1 Tax=Marinicauda salina TaxID=2135793 RepID=UPI001304AD22|nr:divergent polysaccharide deacetylase family protein [Marinicauda salina]
MRAPLLAGGAAAVACIAVIAALALTGRSDQVAVGARAPIASEPPLGLAAAGEPVEFVETEGEAASLPGVSETAETLTAPQSGSGARSEPDRQAASRGAPPAPVEGLYEPGPGGPLPVVAADGRRGSEVYAAPFEGEPDAPTIAVVVGGLGMSRAITQTAIEDLPAEVTLSFVPYAPNLQDWIDRARADGHEVLIELPMEPFDYPNNDPGPHTLLADLDASENRERLEWLLSRAAGYTGVINYLGARLATAPGSMAEIFRELDRRGVAIFHDGSGRRSALADAASRADARLELADRVLDGDPTPRAIEERLLELEALALQDGAALGSGFAYPATVERTARWAEGLAARGYQLAPASYLLRRQAGEAEQES